MEPIITTMLDTDYYKLTMGQLVFKKYVDVPVKYAFVNRTKKVNIADFINERDLREELNNIRKLRFKDGELDYLANLQTNGLRIFQDDYLEYLRNLALPPYELKKENGFYKLEFVGKWGEAIYWEIPALAVINELYYRALTVNKAPQDQIEEIGKKRLAEKIRILRENPGIKFADFGTRRRFAKKWQENVLIELKNMVPGQFIGTSNVDLARRLQVAPIGTFAHEMYMVMSGVMYGCKENIRKSHNVVIKDWWEMYGAGLSTALTDTYGTDFFFRDFTPAQAADWRGLRQDSGDPIEFGEKAIVYYQKLGVDPLTKTLVFSDGLDIENIVKLYQCFVGRINTAFGWGTNLTNDLGYGALSLIIKAIEANGHGTVKLSDNPAKALGKTEDVKRFQEIFDYRAGDYQECRY